MELSRTVCFVLMLVDMAHDHMYSRLLTNTPVAVALALISSFPQ